MKTIRDTPCQQPGCGAPVEMVKVTNTGPRTYAGPRPRQVEKAVCTNSGCITNTADPNRAHKPQP